MTSKRMYYDNIELVPVATDCFPYDNPKFADMWHVPGRTIMSKDALVTLANRKQVAISIVEQDGVNTRTTRLN